MKSPEVEYSEKIVKGFLPEDWERSPEKYNHTEIALNISAKSSLIISFHLSLIEQRLGKIQRVLEALVDEANESIRIEEK